MGRETIHSWWENGFTSEELDSIVQLGLQIEPQEGTVGDGNINDSIRNSTLRWLPFGGPAKWIYDRMAYIMQQLNGQFYDYDLRSLAENIQFTEYHAIEGDKGQFYGWHLDKGVLNVPPRKLTMVVQLSNPEDYEGGDLQTMTGDRVVTLSKERGVAHCFPSWTLHRVTPVTKGKRYSLVVWASGPKFR